MKYFSVLFCVPLRVLLVSPCCQESRGSGSAGPACASGRGGGVGRGGAPGPGVLPAGCVSGTKLIAFVVIFINSEGPNLR